MPTINNVLHNEDTRNVFDVTTANLKGQDKFDFWHAMARQAIVSVEVPASRSSPFDIAARGVVQGGLTLSRIQREPCVIVRNPDHSVDAVRIVSLFAGRPAGNYDRLLDFSRAVTGTLFFVPSATFLDNVAPDIAATTIAIDSTEDSDIEEKSVKRTPARDGSLSVGSLKNEE